MMSGNWVLAFTVLLLLKRAAVGPLPVFARVTTGSGLLAVVLLLTAESPADPLTVVGAWLLFIACAVGFLMFGNEALWILRHRRLPWREGEN